METNNTSVVADLSAALNKDAEHQLNLAKSRYTDLDSILRPWIAFCQIRDIAEPGFGMLLAGHTQALLRLNGAADLQFPWSAPLPLQGAGKRLNLGSAFDPRGWLRADATDMAEFFLPYALSIPTAKERLQKDKRGPFDLHGSHASQGEHLVPR